MGMEELIPFNGKFTIDSPKGEHRTFQIRTAKQGALKGKRILSLLTGPDNTADYTGFAFVYNDAVRVWRKFEGSKNHQIYITMLVDMVQKGEASQFYAMGYRLLHEKKCRRCNRTLTHPESIVSGIGPECASRA